MGVPVRAQLLRLMRSLQAFDAVRCVSVWLPGKYRETARTLAASGGYAVGFVEDHSMPIDLKEGARSVLAQQGLPRRILFRLQVLDLSQYLSWGQLALKLLVVGEAPKNVSVWKRVQEHQMAPLDHR
jgi:hypothetical protein